MIAADEALALAAPEGGAHQHQHEEGLAVGAGEEVVDPGDGLRVRPLRVLDQDGARAGRAGAEDQLGHREPERVARAARVHPLREGLVGEQAGEQALVVDEPSLGDRVLGLLVGGALGQAEQRAEGVGRHAERLPAAEGLAPDEHEPRRAQSDRERRAGALGAACFSARDRFSARDEARQDELPAEAALADARRAGDGDHDGRGVLDAAVVRRRRHDELRVAPDEGRERARIAPEDEAHDPEGGAREGLELEAPAREVGRVRVDEEPAGPGVARERRRVVDHLARGAGAIDPHPARRDADACAARAQGQPQLQRAGGLVAVRPRQPEVRDNRVVAERQRLGPVLAKPLDLPRPRVAARDVQRDQRRHEARAGAARVRGARLRRAGEAGEGRVEQRARDRGRHVARGGRALLRVRREHAVDEIVEPGGDVDEQVREAGRRRRDQAGQGGDGVRPDVRGAARDHLEERGAERVDVAARVGRRVAPRLLGRHVRGRADDRAGARQPHVVRRRHAEVDQLGVEVLGRRLGRGVWGVSPHRNRWRRRRGEGGGARRRDHPGVRLRVARVGVRAAHEEDVRGLDVPVDDARVVRRGQRQGHLPRHLERAPQPERRVPLPGLEVLPVEPLHRDVGRPGLEPPPEAVGARRLQRAERHHAHDAGVGELREHLALALEAGVLDRVRAVRRDDLQRDAPLRHAVVRPVDDARGTAPYLALDAEALRNEPRGGRIVHLGTPWMDQWQPSPPRESATTLAMPRRVNVRRAHFQIRRSPRRGVLMSARFPSPSPSPTSDESGSGAGSEG